VVVELALIPLDAITQAQRVLSSKAKIKSLSKKYIDPKVALLLQKFSFYKSQEVINLTT
jgi:hypothetical protein